MNELLFTEAVNQICLKDSQKEKIRIGCRGIKRRIVFPQWIGAACACLVLLSGLMLWIAPAEKSVDATNEICLEDAVADSDGKTSGENFSEQAYGNNQADVIVVNEYPIMMSVDFSRPCYKLEEYQVVMKNREQVEEYFGRALELTGIPEDMIPVPMEDWKWEFVLKRDTGEVVDDLVGYEYWNDWQDFENGGVKRMVWEGGRGFTVVMSKVDIMSCCIVVPEKDMKTSQINGVEVQIGHRVMGTLYNENHEPEFEYDVYQANFVLDGIEFEVTTEAMTLSELVQIIKSIIH